MFGLDSCSQMAFIWERSDFAIRLSYSTRERALCGKNAGVALHGTANRISDDRGDAWAGSRADPEFVPTNTIP